ncbi:MAG: hypothetical protein UHX91_00625 [Methanosphaera sp.]|nr:hypothetical protein [Methanosphaera sp.]
MKYGKLRPEKSINSFLIDYDCDIYVQCNLCTFWYVVIHDIF